MYSQINDTLLFSFISRYYPAYPNEQILEKGWSLVKDNQKLEKLKNQDLRLISKLVLGQFAYRFGGVIECIGAFGNYYQSRIQEQNKLKILQTRQILSVEQIEQILDPLKNSLLRMCCFLKQNNRLPQLSQKQSIERKIWFLETTLGLGKSDLKLIRNRRIKSKNQQPHRASRLKYSGLSYSALLSRLCPQLQKQSRTQGHSPQCEKEQDKCVQLHEFTTANVFAQYKPQILLEQQRTDIHRKSTNNPFALKYEQCLFYNPDNLRQNK